MPSFDATAESLTLGAAQFSPFYACQVGNGNAVAEQLKVVAYPPATSRRAWRTIVRDGDFTNSTRGRCELLVGGPPPEQSLGIKRFDTVYLLLEAFVPSDWQPPGDPNMLQSKPITPLNYRALPCMTLKPSYTTQLRVGVNGGAYQTAPNPNNGGPVSGKTKTATWNLPVGSLVRGVPMRYIVKVKYDSDWITPEGALAVWHRHGTATEWTKALDEVGLCIGYEDVDTGVMPSHYFRTGMYCVVQPATVEVFIDRLRIGNSFEEVAGTTAVAPVVAFGSSPAAGAVVSGSVPFTANVQQGSAAVARVDFYTDLGPLASDLTSPYAHTVDTTKLPNGSFTIRAKAVDVNGVESAPASRTVTVSNATPEDTGTTTARVVGPWSEDWTFKVGEPSDLRLFGPWSEDWSVTVGGQAARLEGPWSAVTFFEILNTVGAKLIGPWAPTWEFTVTTPVPQPEDETSPVVGDVQDPAKAVDATGMLVITDGSFPSLIVAASPPVVSDQVQVAVVPGLTPNTVRLRVRYATAFEEFTGADNRGMVADWRSKGSALVTLGLASSRVRGVARIPWMHLRTGSAASRPVGVR